MQCPALCWKLLLAGSDAAIVRLPSVGFLLWTALFCHSFLNLSRFRLLSRAVRTSLCRFLMTVSDIRKDLLRPGQGAWRFTNFASGDVTL
jgi:hypothetical protein